MFNQIHDFHTNQYLQIQPTFVVEKTSIRQHKPALVPLFHTTACLHYRKWEEEKNQGLETTSKCLDVLKEWLKCGLWSYGFGLCECFCLCLWWWGLRMSNSTCLWSQPCWATSALGLRRMELERFPNVAALLGVRVPWWEGHGGVFT